MAYSLSAATTQIDVKRPRNKLNRYLWRRHRIATRPVPAFLRCMVSIVTQVSREEGTKNLTLTAEIKRLKESEGVHQSGSDKLNATNRWGCIAVA